VRTELDVRELRLGVCPGEDGDVERALQEEVQNRAAEVTASLKGLA
jgi:hypothetical protein